MPKVKRRLSIAQKQALDNVVEHGNPYYGIVGMAAHGGMHGTMCVIQREKLAVYRARAKRWFLTIKGATALKESKCR